jgi:nanoRNase/pAp phosphatase (c-di-AMP/oligoRNAs hydrolase)
MKKPTLSLTADKDISDQGKHAELAEILETHRGEKHIIVLQDFPDPDGISSALAHKLISSQFDIETDIVYRRKISHQQNKAMVKLLEIELSRFDESLNLAQYQGAVLVDNQGTTAEKLFAALESAGVPIRVLVDHHEPQGRLKPDFVDLRQNVGATATIYAEYLEKGLLELDSSDKDHVMLATALSHGIITDTSGFVRANPEDFYAAAFLSRFRDKNLLEQIMSQARSRQTMEVIHKALGNRQTKENFSFAGIGYLRAEDRDAIPQAADFLLTEDNVHTAIVYGIVTGEGWDETLVGSMRTSKITMDTDEFIKEVFGKNAAGHYFGGGKLSAGGFEIPVGFLAGEHGDDYASLKWKTYDLHIKQKLFDKIGIDKHPAE